MSGQKPKKDNHSHPKSTTDEERENARQQQLKDESRDQGQTSANRDMVRENTIHQQGHPK